MTHRRFWLVSVSLAISAGLILGALHRQHARAAGPTAAETAKTSASSEASKPSVDRSLTMGGKKPADNDTLILAYPDDPETVNPITANDTVSEAFMRLVYDSLADRKYSDPDQWEPSLAESWEFNPETLEFTIHLRKGVYWHPIMLPNGKELPKTEMTNKDVKFSFDCILNKYVEAPHLRSYYENSDSTSESDRFKIAVTIPRGDKYTVKVKWLKPYFLAQEYTLSVPVIPRHVFSVDKNGDQVSLDFSSKEFARGFNDHWANTQMCGTGPLRFKQWKRNDRLVLERNPDFWGKPFYFNRLVFKNIKNPNTMVQAALHGEIDWAPIADKDLYIESKKNANVEANKVKLVEYDYPQYRYLGYNLKRDFFKDKRVRLALGHAVPVDEIIKKIFHGLAVRVTGPFQPGSKGNDTSLPPIDFDLDKAGKLLDEAGWVLKEGESVRTKTIAGKEVQASFDLMIYSEAPSYSSIATIIKENCRKIGVHVQISSTAWALMLEKLRKKDFDACILGWAMSWTDDPNQIWGSRQADIDDSSNHVSYKNPEVDKLIKELQGTMDSSKWPAIYKKIHKLIYEDQPYTFLFADKATAAYDSRIENLHTYRIRPCIDLREWTAGTPRKE